MFEEKIFKYIIIEIIPINSSCICSSSQFINHISIRCVKDTNKSSLKKKRKKQDYIIIIGNKLN